MTKIIKISTVLLVGLGMTTIQANQMKKYDVKSGEVEYVLKGSGDVMGMIQIKIVGKKRVIFDDYGVRNIEEKNEVKKETVRGNTKVHKTHTMTYMNNTIIYKVDFEKKSINRMKNQGAGMATLFGGGDNLKESGEAMMKKMGGKKFGTDTVLGFTCEVWELMGSKQCIYKGIPLRIMTDVMGMKSVEIATKAEFDMVLSRDDFKLPNYPVYDFDMDRMMDGEKPQELDKYKLDKMDSRDNAKAGKEAEEGAEAMKGLAAGFAALAKTGIDMSSSKDLTADQELVMQKSMMKAMSKSMGGEAKMLAKMKQEIVADGKMEEMQFSQKCFGAANTLNEANSCVDKGNQMFGDDEEHMYRWTVQDKKELLDDIKGFEKLIPCVKAAQTMEVFQQCMPRDN